MPSTQSAISVRSLEPLDLPAALAIQSQAYPEFLRENRAAFASRLEFPTSYCFAATRHGSVVAYLLAHGWRAESPPPVGVALSSDTTVEVLSVHDLAVSSLERAWAQVKRSSGVHSNRPQRTDFKERNSSLSTAQ